VTSHTVYGIVPVDATGGLLPASKSLITAPPAVSAKMPPAPQYAGAASSMMQPATGLSANAMALHCARNLIECFFNKIKQFARIATWAKLTCRSSVGRCYHPAEYRSE
jgi:hypothetical protein